LAGAFGGAPSRWSPGSSSRGPSRSWSHLRDLFERLPFGSDPEHCRDGGRRDEERTPEDVRQRYPRPAAALDERAQQGGRCEAPDRGSDRVKEQRPTMPTSLYGATPDTTEQPRRSP